VRNDFWDAEKFDQWLKSGAGGNYIAWRATGGIERRSDLDEPWTRMRLIVQNDSRLYALVHYARNVYRDWRSGEPRTLRLADGGRLHLMPSDLESMTANARPGHPEFEIVVEALERMQAIAKRDGTRMVVVFQPSKEEVYLPLLDGSAPDPGAPLRAALDARGIEYLDLLPVFRERADTGVQLFFENDGHPNRKGYRLIADTIGAYLKETAAPSTSERAGVLDDVSANDHQAALPQGER
jgi:hypothetical protein